jgi:hypothetical protein
MERITARNLVLLALTQIGVLVAAVLGAGAAHKWYTALPNIIPVPRACELLVEYGWLGLPVPAIWLGVALRLLTNRHVTDGAKLCAVLSGALLVALGLALAWYGAVWPWWRLVGSYD